LFVPIAGVFVGMLRHRPHVFELRDLWPASIAANTSMRPGRFIRWLERLELWLYRRSTRVLAFTESFRRDLVHRGIPAEKIDVVINGANVDLFKPVTAKDPEILTQYALNDRFVVGYLGTLGLSQGLGNVIEAAEHLRDTPITFFFVGVGAVKAELEEQVRVRGLKNVVFAPRQPKEAMPRFWSVCDVSLVHLKNDPVFATVIPSKIFESMAVGLPILYCGPKGDGTDIVEHCKAGVVVPAADPQALAAAAKQLAANSSLRLEYATNSAASAPAYSRERQAAACLAVLKKAQRPAS
jgi:glycosyltransferase involved in cell wall biosynthesis